MAHQNSFYERSKGETIKSRNEEKKFENSSSSPTTSIATCFHSSNSDSSESEDDKACKTEEETRLKREKEHIFNRRNFYESTDAYRRRKERRYRKRSHSRSRSISPIHHKSQHRSRSGAEESQDHQQSCVKSEESNAKTEKEEPRVHDDVIKANRQKISSQSPNNNIVLPSYYNRKMINPKKYAEQIRKRKLLWGRKVQNNDIEDSREQRTCNFWQKTSFDDDENGKTTAKFKRLMGIRSESKNDTSQLEERHTDVIEKQKEMFDSMQNQYDAARVATHTHRGVGLGFGMFPFHTQEK